MTTKHSDTGSVVSLSVTTKHSDTGSVVSLSVTTNHSDAGSVVSLRVTTSHSYTGITCRPSKVDESGMPWVMKKVTRVVAWFLKQFGRTFTSTWRCMQPLINVPGSIVARCRGRRRPDRTALWSRKKEEEKGDEKEEEEEEEEGTLWSVRRRD